MNKNLFTKIATAFASFAMAIGVGVAIGSGDKNYVRVNASTYDYTFTAKQFDGNKTVSLGGVSWTLANSGNYFGYEASKGQQFGSGSAVSRDMTLTTSGISGTISSVVVYASTANSATANINCTVGGNSFGVQAQSMTNSNKPYTFSGSASGSVVINLKQPSTSKALYIKQISITYSTGTNYDVYFNNNTGSGTMQSAKTTGSEYTTPDCTFTKTDYVFSKWALNSTSGAQYAAGEKITGIKANITLYAIWVEDHSIKDTITASDLAASGSSYDPFSNVGKTSTAKYFGRTAKSGNNIQFNSGQTSSEDRGIATSASGGYIRAVSVTFGNDNSKTLAIRVSNSAFTKTSIQSGGTLIQTKLSGSVKRVTIAGNYTHVAVYGDSGAIYPSSITFEWEEPPILSSITTSGQKETFTQGESFSYGGTLTAHYTQGKADVIGVTPKSKFYYAATSTVANPETGATEITGTMSISAHNGKYVYVGYTEDNITKWVAYQITVSYATVTDLAISQNSAALGYGESFNCGTVTVTITPANADPNYTWSVDTSKTTATGYTFTNNTLTAGSADGVVVLKCASDAKPTVYKELTVTISGAPEGSFNDDSLTIYIGVDESQYADFTYINIDDEDVDDIVFTSGNTSFYTVGEVLGIEGTGTVTLIPVASGTATLTMSYGGNTLDTISITVSADAVDEVNWAATNFDVFTNEPLTSSIVSGWNVNYHKLSGATGNLSFGQYTLKLGESTINSLPYDWSPDDDGEELWVEYGGTASAHVSVTVTQILRPIMKPGEAKQEESDLTFTAACGGSGTATDGASWTVTSDGTESTFDNTKGIHYGTGKVEVQYIKLTSSSFNTGKITKVVVNASTANDVSATASVKVGNSAFGGEPQSISTTATNYTFTGNVDADDVEVLITKPSSATKAIYCKSIVVTYETPGQSTNIANNPSHKAAQRAVVRFARRFNAALGATNECTTGLSDAWATATLAYNNPSYSKPEEKGFLQDIEGLSQTEQDWAKDLLANASAKWTEDTDENYEYCVERCLATYIRCVTKHGQTKFMQSIRPVDGAAILPFAIGNDAGSTTAAIVIISIVSLTAVGGFFFIRKKKIVK